MGWLGHNQYENRKTDWKDWRNWVGYGVMFSALGFSIYLIFSGGGCASMGPDYSDAKRFCRNQKSEFKDGNPIYFSCTDGTNWKRASHGNYDFQGSTK